MKLSNEWKEYEIIDASNGMKLERWNNINLLRPDPQIIWNNGKLEEIYNNIDAIYYRSNKGGGHWENINNIPSSWIIEYKNLKFNIKQMGFKHTGLFPEQALNWDFMINKINNSKRKIKVLNLFAYTGGATIACMSANAHVTHVDSSRGMVDWCKENVRINELDTNNVRYIVDDVVKFVEREIRRGNTYDAIIMDPPSYGRGANKEVWNIEKNLNYLVEQCTKILSNNPLFFIINSYSTGLSEQVLENILKLTVNRKIKGVITSSQIGLPIKENDLVLPCGIYGRWENNE